MDFLIGEADKLKIQSSSVSELLKEVYVSENFVELDVATKLFETKALEKRGIIICAIEKQSLALAGVVFVVSSKSSACQMAQDDETEMHLLCVKNKYRNNGLGKNLIKSAITMATKNGSNKMILWTQQSMKSAQRLYLNAQFVHVNSMTKNSRDFLVYEKLLKA